MSQYRSIRDAVWACRSIGGSAKLVALRLVEHWPRIMPSVASLAEFTGLGTRTVERALHELEKSGVISVDLRPGRRSEYAFVGVAIPELGTPVKLTAPPPSNLHPTPVRMTDEAGSSKQTSEAVGRKRRPPPVQTPLPADWAPSKQHREFARNMALDLDTEVFAFKGWAEGRTALSWNGTFSTRLANSVKWRSERGVTPKPASAVYDDAPFYKDPAR